MAGRFEIHFPAQNVPAKRSPVEILADCRLRSVIRYRKGREGMSRGRENPEYPNQWFKERGLFTLYGDHPRTEQ